ncbi:5'/3'-nucleotidase SurE [Halanaerobacter jeridensis]|uniref:5'-nucleotidase SurE n=1 Tax=Halanaerobacter jeridensis TaxID=706427 RepID=A0A939BQA3_9FIRM|nr:5'/3'-nucleotidase SurE [Halanaerobacter jeridensis]MBM7557903.1 5'-nucleotidase [Halanaerobacter jeridensis]
MKILLTNDDGIFAPGIRALCKELEKDHDVTVVAPDRERSAAGHAITIHYPLRVKEMEFDGINSKCIAVDGTPADCVKIAYEALIDEKIDLLISGINIGPNLGRDVLYSGTVSAAIEGLLLGLPSIAVSLVADDHWDFKDSAKYMRKFVKEYQQQDLKKDVLLNINIPIDYKEGTKVTELGDRGYTNSFEERLDPREQKYYWLAGELVEEGTAEGTDVTAAKNNFISITPIKLNLTSHDHLEELKKWNI